MAEQPPLFGLTAGCRLSPILFILIWMILDASRVIRMTTIIFNQIKDTHTAQDSTMAGYKPSPVVEQMLAMVSYYLTVSS